MLDKLISLTKIMDSQKNNDIIVLLTDIQDLIIDNDLECTENGSDIYNRINVILYDLQSGQPG